MFSKLKAELDAVMARQLPHAEPVSRRQSTERDIAVVVPEGVTHQQLMQAVHAAPSEGLLRGATLFDIYRPKPGADAAGGANLGIDEKSLAVRLVLDGGQETLTDERIETAVQSVLAQWQADVGARLRG